MLQVLLCGPDAASQQPRPYNGPDGTHERHPLVSADWHGALLQTGSEACCICTLHMAGQLWPEWKNLALLNMATTPPIQLPKQFAGSKLTGCIFRNLPTLMGAMLGPA